MEVVYVTGDQKSDFKNLKQENQNCYVPEKFSSLLKENVSHGWSLFASARATSILVYADQPMRYLHVSI